MEIDPIDPPLRVALVSGVFPPEFTYSARTSANIAEQLAADGHNVTVYAPFPNRPAGKLFEGFRRSLYASRRDHGYKLVHCFSILAPESRMLTRFMENVSFGITSSLRLLFSTRPDVIYSNNWPVFATGMLMLVAKLRRVPVVLSVQDVFPECLTIQGRLSEGHRLWRIVRRIDVWNAHAAREIIVLSERFREIYVADRGIPARRIHVIQNWGERDVIEIDAAESLAYRRARSIPKEAMLAVYAGNIGPAAGVEGLIRSFELLKDEPNLYLLIAGSGARLESVRRMADALACKRVVFHSPWKESETTAVLGAADVLLLPTIGKQSLVSVPSKIISYFLAGRPVIAGVLAASETAHIVSTADAGWIVPPEDDLALAQALREAMSAGKELVAKGEKARQYAYSNLSRQSNLPRVLRVIHSCTKARHHASAMRSPGTQITSVEQMHDNEQH